MSAHAALADCRLEGEWFRCPESRAVGAIASAAHEAGQTVAAAPPGTPIEEVVADVSARAAVGPEVDRSKRGFWPSLLLPFRRDHLLGRGWLRPALGNPDPGLR
jgi:hypothetical protein